MSASSDLDPPVRVWQSNNLHHSSNGPGGVAEIINNLRGMAPLAAERPAGSELETRRLSVRRRRRLPSGLAAIPVWMSPEPPGLGLPNSRGSRKIAPEAPVDTLRRTASDALWSLEATVYASPQ